MKPVAGPGRVADDGYISLDERTSQFNYRTFFDILMGKKKKIHARATLTLFPSGLYSNTAYGPQKKKKITLYK